MLDVLAQHGLVGGGSGGRTLSEQVDRDFVIADGENIAAGDPVFIDKNGKLRKALAVFPNISTKFIFRPVRYAQNLSKIVTDDTLRSLNIGEVQMLPNAFATRFAVLEHNGNHLFVKVYEVRDGEGIRLLLNQQVVTGNYQYSPSSILALYHNDNIHIAYVKDYNGGNSATVYVTRVKVTHDAEGVTLTTYTVSTASASAMWLYNLVAFDNGDTGYGGKHYNGTSNLGMAGSYNAETNTSVVSFTSSFLGASYADIAAAFASFHNDPLRKAFIKGENNTGATSKNVGQITSALIHTTEAVVALTESQGSYMRNPVLERYRQAANVFIGFYLGNQYGRLFATLFTSTGTGASAITLNKEIALDDIGDQYPMTLYRLEDNLVMLLLHDRNNGNVEFRTYSIAADFTISLVRKKVITLSRTIVTAQRAGNVVMIGYQKNDEFNLGFFAVDKNDVTPVSHHGFAGAAGTGGQTVKLVYKGEVPVTGLVPNTDYYLKPDGTRTTANTGVYLGYAKDDKTLVVTKAFYEKEGVFDWHK